MNKNLLAVLLSLSMLVTATLACSFTNLTSSVLGRTGELRQDVEVVPLKSAAFATVNLRMGAGELRIDAGKSALVEAQFTYNVPDWQPTIDYSASGGQGDLWIEQPKVSDISIGSYRYEWDLHFNPDIPLAFNVELGAGESRLDLSQLTVTSLDMKTGVGFVEVDLTGDREQDMDVSIRGGVGEVKILLPSEVGVQVQAAGGLGEIDTKGLSRQGNNYVNDAYGESDHTITLDIEGGIGAINLEVVD
jgi:hypothetical protein